MLLSVFLEFKKHFRILLLPPHYPLDFQARIPAALCALHNFIQETDSNEGEIPTDPGSAYEHLPSDGGNRDHDDSFVTEEDEDVTPDVKSHRINIANAMWDSYIS